MKFNFFCFVGEFSFSHECFWQLLSGFNNLISIDVEFKDVTSALCFGKLAKNVLLQLKNITIRFQLYNFIICESTKPVFNFYRRLLVLLMDKSDQIEKVEIFGFPMDKFTKCRLCKFFGNYFHKTMITDSIYHIKCWKSHNKVVEDEEDGVMLFY